MASFHSIRANVRNAASFFSFGSFLIFISRRGHLCRTPHFVAKISLTYKT
jgi:hypothetical protein